MRTTTKRGLGRGAAADGNGNGRAVLPPLAAGPVTLYRQPEPPRRSVLSVVGRIVLWLLGAVAVLAAGLAGGAYLYFHETVSDLTDATPQLALAAKGLDVALPDAPTTALVIGYDKRAGIERGLEARSDTIMLLRADPRARTLSTLSFLRDLRVEIRCGSRPPYVGRINGAYSDCGERGVLDTVKNLTGLPINYIVTVNFRGFKQLVASVGGVWLDVDRRYFNPPGMGYATIDLQPGYQKLGGSDALDFVRYRHADSDHVRVARQQLFVQAFKRAVTTSFSPTDPSNLLKLVRVVRDNVDVGAPGKGTIGFKTATRYALLAYQLPPGHVFQSRIDPNCYADQADFSVTVAESCVRDAVQDFANPDVEAPAKATDVAVGRKRKREAAPPPSRTTLVVLNGNGVEGAAANTSWALAQRGYVALTPPAGAEANAPRQDYLDSVVYYDRARGRPAVLAARRLAGLVGDAEVQPRPGGRLRALSGRAMLTLVVGQTFRGSLAPAPVDRTPKKQPAYVRADPAATRDLLRPHARRLPFPVMVPHVLEKTSLPARDTPVRVYRIAGHRTLRLTFATGASEYWGIQQVSWNGAPALRGPNEVLRLKGGRRLELHYTGARLRMVVVRRGKATYWVTNTLVNTLSNETMIAIAKGLRPLGRG